MKRALTRALATCALLSSVVACERAAHETDGEAAAPAAAETATADSPIDEATPAGSGQVEPSTGEPTASPGAADGEGTAPQPATPLASSPADVPRMPVQEAGSRARSGEVVIVDVRDAESYRGDHIAGAVNIPLGEIATRASELPRGKVIVTYCA